MRRGVAILALPALLGACHSEPSFDQRYTEAEMKIHETAMEIDRNLAPPQRPAQAEEPAKQQKAD